MAVLYEILIHGVYISSWSHDQAQMIYVSRPGVEKTDLLAIMQLPPDIPGLDLSVITSSFGTLTLNPITVRRELSKPMRELMSKHLLLGLDKLDFKDNLVTSDSAWRYEQLVEWGESSAVVVLAKHMGIGTGTMRARLAQARLNGMLESPGRGSRRPQFGE